MRSRLLRACLNFLLLLAAACAVATAATCSDFRPLLKPVTAEVEHLLD